MRCPHCDQEHPDGIRFCPSTGQELTAVGFCTNCGSEIQQSWNVCPRCGAPIDKAKSSNSIKHRKSRIQITQQRSSSALTLPKRSFNSLVIVSVIVLLIILSSLYVYYNNFYRPNGSATLPSPMIAVPFPSDQIPYPTEWPEELRYPENFLLVDTSSGMLPESTAQAWSARLRYQGEPSKALKAMIAFFEERDWTIVENNQIDSGGFLLLLKRGQGEGIVVMDVDPNSPSLTLVVATFFP